MPELVGRTWEGSSLLQNGSIFVLAMGYIAVLFLVASYGDRRRRPASEGSGLQGDRPAIYALSLAVFCTSWTFFGSVGLATRNGLEFLAIYVGPAIFVILGHKLLKRIVLVSKAQRIASMADFIGARYGKNTAVAAVAAMIAVFGTIPYIALQLKAVATSLEYLVTSSSSASTVGDISAYVALTMAVFAVLFGTRHADATEHQDGMMLAVAAESVVKLAVFIIVGLFVTVGLFGGISGLFEAAQAQGVDVDRITSITSWPRFIILCFMSLGVFILLPRIFHVAVVESRSDRELERAMTLFPLYLIAINLFVVPIAIAGLVTFGPSVDADIFVLALPLSAGEPALAVTAFIGGLSAATAMVIVATVALAIMISNDLVLPFLLRQQEGLGKPSEAAQQPGPNMVRRILNVRRTAIFLVMFFAFVYYRSAGDAALAAIGLMSFAALLQVAPAFFGGLVWRRATSRGALAGMIIGFSFWAYTLLLPTLLTPASALLAEGPFGLNWLRPEGLFGIELDPLLHGVIVSMAANLIAYVAGSLSRPQDYLERVQASIFIPLSSSSLTIRHKQPPILVREVRRTVARFLGDERTNRSFGSFMHGHAPALRDDEPASPELLEYAEQLLASAIGTSSSRLILSLMLQRHDPVQQDTAQLLDDASVAIQYNRDLLQTALDKVEQGLTVFDRSKRLVLWNRQFRDLLNLPVRLGEVGTDLSRIYDELYDRGDLVGITYETFRKQITSAGTPWNLRLRNSGRVFEIVSNEMPDGGVVTTYADITQTQQAAADLRNAKEDLEQRVKDRTSELTDLNEALELERQRADDANDSKTKFLAAAGHDILQPLNAARLYTAFLKERSDESDLQDTAGNLEVSLDAVEEILGAVLAISRLDAGHWKPNIQAVALQDVFERLRTEFTPIAADKGLKFKIVDTSAHVLADPNLLKRLLQNLVSNGLKYSRSGGVVVGVRGTPTGDDQVRIEVTDSGAGIKSSDRAKIFNEFQRLPDASQFADGLGLGLSIVERIASVLDAEIDLTSEPGKGSSFSVTLPRSHSTALAMPLEKSAPGRTSVDAHGALVLCIDNDTAILEGMETLLRNWGCHVLKAENLAQANYQIHRAGAQPDIVLCDYHLDADENGLSLIAKLKNASERPLPSVLITADRSPETKLRAQEMDVPILNKPVKPAALRAVIAKVRPAAAKAAE